MALEVTALHGGKLLRVRATDKLTQSEYEAFVPRVEELIRKHGKLRVLLELHDFHGWTAGALWEDVKFALKHFADVERIAVVGETRWQEGMTAFCRPFTTANIQFFPPGQAGKARQWVAEGLPTDAAT